MRPIRSHSYINYIIFSLVISIGLIISACTSGSEQREPSSQLESSETPQASPPTSTPAPSIVEELASPTPVPPTVPSPPETLTATPSEGLHETSGLLAGEIRHLWVDPDGQL